MTETYALLKSNEIGRYLREGRFPDDFVRNHVTAPCICDMCRGTMKPRVGRNIESYYKRFQKSKIKKLIVKQRDGFKCVRCDSTDDLTIDHIVPMAVGGTHAYHNLQTLCWQCHANKNREHRQVSERPRDPQPEPIGTWTTEQLQILNDLREQLSEVS